VRRHPRWAWPAGVFILALGVRLAYLFVFTNGQNPGDGPYIDAYQHWQIAYLTQQIGLGHGLRLWDLKGVEYFWSTLHPLLLAVVFGLLHTSDILVDRLVSTVAGAAVVPLIFVLCRRYWGFAVALFAALLVAILPIAVFNDTSGMLEPPAVALMLLGVWLMPDRPFLAGGMWGLAAAERPEAWLFSAGLIVGAFLQRKPDHDPRAAAYGWGLVMVAQMLFLWSRTGNPIYPVYWNFLANAAGKWVDTPGASQLAIRPLFLTLWLLATVGLGAVLWRRPRGFLFLLYGFGYSALVMGLFAFTPILSVWSSWTWMMWLLEFPYEFAAVLTVVGVFHLASGFPRGRALAGWVLAPGLLLTLLIWAPLQAVYTSTAPAWQSALSAGRLVGGLYTAVAQGHGGLNLPPDRPDLTYALVHDGGVPAPNLVSQLYDPLYYRPPGDPIPQGPTLDRLFGCWLTATDSRILLVDGRQAVYAQVVADEPGWFRPIGDIPELGLTVEAVVTSARPCR
jgi:hypothetical protein